jgi:hypothetical protein
MMPSSDDVEVPQDKEVWPDTDYEEESSHTDTDIEYNEEEDDAEGEFEFGDGGGWVPKKKTKRKKTTPGANGGLPNFQKGAYDKDYWNCSRVGSVGQFVKMIDTTHGGAYVVPISRVNKALRFLHQPTIAAILRASDGVCRCKRQPPCFQRGLTTHSILEHRHTFFQQLDEYGATKYLGDLVRPHNVQPRSAAPSKNKNVWTV